MSKTPDRRGGIPLPAPAAAFIFGCIALLFFGLATKELTGQWDYRVDSTSAPGVVQEAEYIRGLGTNIAVALDGPDAHHVVSIVDPNGAPTGLQPGQDVTVLYDAARPTQAMFPSQLSWTRPALLGGLGLAGLTLCMSRAIVAIRAGRAKAKRQDKTPRSGPPFNNWGKADQGPWPNTNVDRSNEPLFPDKKWR